MDRDYGLLYSSLYKFLRFFLVLGHVLGVRGGVVRRRQTHRSKAGTQAGLLCGYKFIGYFDRLLCYCIIKKGISVLIYWHWLCTGLIYYKLTVTGHGPCDRYCNKPAPVPVTVTAHVLQNPTSPIPSSCPLMSHVPAPPAYTGPSLAALA